MRRFAARGSAASASARPELGLRRRRFGLILALWAVTGGTVCGLLGAAWLPRPEKGDPREAAGGVAPGASVPPPSTPQPPQRRPPPPPPLRRRPPLRQPSERDPAPQRQQQQQQQPSVPPPQSPPLQLPPGAVAWAQRRGGAEGLPRRRWNPLAPGAGARAGQRQRKRLREMGDAALSEARNSVARYWLQTMAERGNDEEASGARAAVKVILEAANTSGAPADADVLDDEVAVGRGRAPAGRERISVWTEIDAGWTWGPRIGLALEHFAPKWVSWADDPRKADVRLLHIVGHVERRRALQMREPPFVAIQHVVGTAAQEDGMAAPADANNSVELWARFWQRALLTVSFHELDAAGREHGFDFLPLPWGADPAFFRPPLVQGRRAAAILCAGSDPVSESFGELLWAAAHANLSVWHVGSERDVQCGECPPCPACKHGVAPSRQPQGRRPLHCQPQEGLLGRAPCAWWVQLGRVTDLLLSQLLRRVRYASGLRKEEGFELLGVEALLSGAVPIVYDLPTYRRWYEGFARIVRHDHAAEDLARILAEVPPESTPADLQRARAAFSWGVIVRRLFGAVRDRLRRYRAAQSPRRP
eukprot:TRINITY_DN17437_c0_g1_i1.p1 TRINITY_DN17437_c0_g1~~TRINITY_DN17437_c0_g1_i1.p1  ORF type:complete len:610 (+),score=176.11 TRINITY_DN17437_c0_g1_i1:62-1831(+)